MAPLFRDKDEMRTRIKKYEHVCQTLDNATSEAPTMLVHGSQAKLPYRSKRKQSSAMITPKDNEGNKERELSSVKRKRMTLGRYGAKT